MKGYLRAAINRVMENQIKCGLFPYIYSTPPPAKHLSVDGLTNGLLAGHFVDIAGTHRAGAQTSVKHLCSSTWGSRIHKRENFF